MMTSERQPMDQTPDTTKQGSSTTASRLASLARDQFWAARRAGNRAAMVHWSARESVLRRRSHRVTDLIPIPAHARAVG